MKTKIVGILNYTTDSFSDGGEFFSLEKALKKAEDMFAEGADIVDVGANSTNYNSKLLTATAEWKRVEPLLQILGPRYGKHLSFDTFYYQNAQKAIDLGVCMINDVSGAKEPGMIEVIARNQHVKYVLMHSLVLPANKSVRARHKMEIYDFGARGIHQLIEQGVERNRIIFDPGIGYVTDPKLSFEVLSDLSFFRDLGVPIYIGHSRKSFMEELTTLLPGERDIETLAASLYLVLQHVDYLRIHNVAIHARSLKIWKRLAS